jgi:hypothetical protein
MYVDKKREKAKWFRSLFQHTEVVTLEDSVHITSHFSPNPNLDKLIALCKNAACTETRPRIIINHKREFLLCCEDVTANFGLGTFPETSLYDYWYSKKHTQIITHLDKPGGRKKYKYCSICPRP